MRAAVLTLLLAGCSPFEPTNGQRYDPPPLYRTLYEAVEQCTGRQGSFAALRFYAVPVEGMDVSGKTFGQDIYIREDFVGRHLVIKHDCRTLNWLLRIAALSSSTSVIGHAQ